MGYPPPPPPPGTPGGYGPPPGPPSGYGPPPGSPPPPPGGGYGGPPTGGYGGPPPGYGGPPPGPAPAPGSGSSKGPLVALMAALVVVVLLVVVGAVVLVSTGGDDQVELTSAQRTDALLTAGDLGDDFSESDSDSSGSPDSLSGGSECEEVLDRLDEEGTNPFGNDDDPSGLVERSLADADGVIVEEGLAPTVDVVAAYRDLVGACDELTLEDEGTTATISLSEGDDPDVGDDSVRVDASFSIEGDDGLAVDFDGTIIAWTRDGTDGLLSFTDGFSSDTGEPVPYDDDLVDDAITRADERLAEVIDEA